MNETEIFGSSIDTQKFFWRKKQIEVDYVKKK